MQFFPRDGHGLARLQVLYATRHFFVLGSLNRFVRVFEAVEQSVGQSSALVGRERECSFQEISNLWTHGIILPLGVYSANARVSSDSVQERGGMCRRIFRLGCQSAASPDVDSPSDRCGAGVFDLFKNLECGLGVFDGLLAVAEFVQFFAHVVSPHSSLSRDACNTADPPHYPAPPLRLRFARPTCLTHLATW
jgi:hypothetical protein